MCSLELFSFSEDKIIPPLASVQAILGIGKSARDGSGREATDYDEISELYRSLVFGQGSVMPATKAVGEVLFEDSPTSILYKRFLGSKYPYLFLATIGSKVEEKAEELMATGEYVKGGLLDAFASAGVELVVDLLQKKVAEFVNSTCVRFSPGYGQWDLKVQSFFIKHLDGKNMGISLNDSFMFTPHKTVSGIIVPKE